MAHYRYLWYLIRTDADEYVLIDAAFPKNTRLILLPLLKRTSSTNLVKFFYVGQTIPLLPSCHAVA